MRFTVSVLGTEVFSISTDAPTEDQLGEHDLNCSREELVGDAPIGFRIHTNPSLREVPT